MKKREHSLTEVLLRERGHKTLAGNGNPAEGPDAIDDADRELLVAYLERRLSRTEEKAIRRRLSAEPAFREALADIVAAARDTKYGEALLAETAAAGVRAVERRTVFALPLARATALAAAALVAVVCIGVWWRFGPGGDGGVEGALPPAIATRLAQLSSLREQGRLDEARRGYVEMAAAQDLPESNRNEVIRLAATLSVHVWERHIEGKAFDNADALFEEIMRTDAIRKQATDGILVACVADARKQDLLPPEPGIETPSATRATMFRDVTPLDRLIAYSRRAQQADPNDLAAWLAEVEARLAKGYLADLDAAQTALDRAVDLAPDNPDVHNALGRLHYQRSRFSKSPEDAQRARAAFERALELDPNHKAARASLENLKPD